MKRTLLLLLSILPLCQSASAIAGVYKSKTIANVSETEAAEITGDEPELLKYLLGLNSELSQEGEVESVSAKMQILVKKGLSYGAQGGRYWAMGELEKHYNKKNELLLSTFDFRKLMISYRGYLIQPAQVVELDGKTTFRNDGRQLRTAEKLYSISEQPKFVQAVPTWRNFLSFERKKPDIRYLQFLPDRDNSEEVRVWQQAVLKGWAVGVEDAKRAISINFAEMASAFESMTLYHILVNRKMLSEPIVDRVFFEVTGGSSNMSINDVTLTIKTNPKLNTNRFDWVPIPELPPLKDLYPEGFN